MRDLNIAFLKKHVGMTIAERAPILLTNQKLVVPELMIGHFNETWSTVWIYQSCFYYRGTVTLSLRPYCSLYIYITDEKSIPKYLKREPRSINSSAFRFIIIMCVCKWEYITKALHITITKYQYIPAWRAYSYHVVKYVSLPKAKFAIIESSVILTLPNSPIAQYTRLVNQVGF